MQATTNTINTNINHYQQKKPTTEDVKEVKPVELNEKTEYPVKPDKDNAVNITPEVLEKSRAESRTTGRTGGNGTEPPRSRF